MHWIDPDGLPENAGTVERFIVNPHGEIDGLVMTDAQAAPVLVHTPPHMGQAIGAHFKKGARVKVRGIRPRGAAMIAAVALATQDGKRLVDHGPDDHKKPKHGHRDRQARPMESEGTVRLSLFGPKGELRGALLGDGTVVRIGPKEAAAFAALLRPGARLAVRGNGLVTDHGRVIAVEAISPSLAALRLKGQEDKPKHRHEPDAAAQPDA